MDKTQVTVLAQVSLQGICKVAAPHPDPKQEAVETTDLEEVTEALPVPLPLSDVPGTAGLRPFFLLSQG